MSCATMTDLYFAAAFRSLFKFSITRFLAVLPPSWTRSGRGLASSSFLLPSLVTLITSSLSTPDCIAVKRPSENLRSSLSLSSAVPALLSSTRYMIILFRLFSLSCTSFAFSRAAASASCIF